MHVLMTTDTLGGVFTYSIGLSSWLVGRGLRVTLASMGGPATPEQRERAERVGARLIESNFRLEWMDEPWPDVWSAGAWLLDLERRLKPDLIHLNGYAHGALPWKAPALVVAHSCVLSWWRAVLGEAAPARYGTYREAVARGLQAASSVVAPSRAMLDALGREHGPRPDARVIHNGLALPEPDARPKEPFVLSAGRVWDAAKNFALLQAAASAVSWPIRLAGDATPRDARRAQTFPALHQLGVLHQRELAQWMARAAIFAAPATYEPFGLSILEAAAHGCALVLGDIPSLRELWDGAALFADPRDDGALSAALSRLIAEPTLRARLGQRAREHAARYGIERTGSSYLRLYHSLFEQGAVARQMELSS